MIGLDIGESWLDKWLLEVDKLMPDIMNPKTEFRASVADEIIAAGFDIGTQAEKLAQLYNIGRGIKPKIAVFIRGFHGGGIEKVFENYFTHMDLSPFEIHIITHMENMPEKKKMFEDMGCIIHELSRLHGSRIRMTNIREYKKLFAENEYDIIHNNMPENLLPFIFGKKSRDGKRILHSHNNYTENFREKNPIIQKLFMAGYAFNVNMATQLVAVSKIAAKSVFGKQRKREVLYLPNAIEVEKYKFNPEVRVEYRKKFGIGNELVIGHIGRYENDQKNQEFVLEMFRQLLENKIDCRLLMLGCGKRLDEYKVMSEELGIAPKVIFTGNVPNVSDYLQAMDVFVLPSRREGLGIAAIEAQASGLPCLLSDRIPIEAKASKNVRFLSIEHGVDQWVTEVLAIDSAIQIANRQALK